MSLNYHQYGIPNNSNLVLQTVTNVDSNFDNSVFHISYKKLKLLFFLFKYRMIILSI